MSGTVVPRGQLDVPKDLADGQSEDAGVVVVLRCDSQRSRSQLVIESCRASQSIGVIIKETSDLGGGQISATYSRSVRWAYQISNTVVACEIVRTALGVDVRDVQDLDERVPDISYGIHNLGGSHRGNDPKVMCECENWPLGLNLTELRVHRVV